MAEQKPKFAEDVPVMMGVSRTTGEARQLKLNDDGTPYIDLSDTGGTPYQFSGTASETVNTTSLGVSPANSFAVSNTDSANTLYVNVTDGTPSVGTVYYALQAGGSLSVDANVYRYSVKADSGKTATFQGLYTKN